MNLQKTYLYQRNKQIGIEFNTFNKENLNIKKQNNKFTHGKISNNNKRNNRYYF